MVYILPVWVSPVDIKVSHGDGTKSPNAQMRLERTRLFVLFFKNWFYRFTHWSLDYDKISQDYFG